MEFIGQLLLLALDIYLWVILISVILSWLLAFGVINARSPQAQKLLELLDRATDPVYRPLRRVIPPFGGIDITPMIVIIGIMIAKNIVAQLFFF